MKYLSENPPPKSTSLEKSSSKSQMSSSRKLWWNIFSIFTLIAFVGIPSYSLFWLVRHGGAIGRFFILFDYIFLPTFVTFSLLLWLPLITRSKKSTMFTTAALVLSTIALLNFTVPTKYFFPEVLLLLLAYIVFFVLAYKAVLPIGVAMKNVMAEWWATYNSPKNLYDLAKNIPGNVIAGFKIDLLRIVAGTFLVLTFSLIALLTWFHPAVWGVGLFEVGSSFSNENEFQKASKKRFFYENELLENIFIQRYSRNIPIAYSPCRLSTSGDSNLKYIDLGREIVATEKKSGKTFAIATVDDGYLPLSESPLLIRDVRNDVQIFSYSETYFRLAGYPSKYDYPDSSLQLPVFKDQFIKDKNSRWFVKNKRLLCAEVNSPLEENRFAYILELLKTDETSNPAQIGKWVEPTPTPTLPEEKAPCEDINNYPQVYTNITDGLKVPESVCTLDLSDKKLTEIPSEIGQFSNLKMLYLHLNRLSQLPPEVGNLTNLEYLSLGNNLLTSLPPEVGKLKKLKRLELGNNKITTIPPQAGQMVELTELYLNSNPIQEFPTELSELKNLKELHLEGTSLSEMEKNKIKELLPNTRIFF